MMRNHRSSILAVGVLALALTACSGTADNTAACQDLVNVQGELDGLVSRVPSDAAEAHAMLPRLVELADEAKNLDADGDVKTAATSLGDAADAWHDALKTAADDDAFDDAISTSLAAIYVEAHLDVGAACSRFLA